MATIATTTRADPFVYPGMSHIDRMPAGLGYALWTAVINAAGTGIDFYQASSAGVGWTLRGTFSPGVGILEMSSLFIDGKNLMWFAYRTNQSSQDRIYINRAYDTSPMTFGAGALLSSPGNGGSAGAIYSGMDVTVVWVGDGSYRVAVAVGTTDGSIQGVTLLGCYVSSGGQFTAGGGVISGRKNWNTIGTGRQTPSCEIEHSGDGRSGGAGSPHLWVVYGRASLRVVKATWTGSGWSGPSGDVGIMSVPAQDSLAGRWTGQEWVMTTLNPADSTTVLLVQRNRANTVTKSWPTPTHPAGVVRSCSFSYDTVTRDVRVYAIGTSSAVLHYCDFARDTSTFTGWTQVLATAVLGATPQNFGIRRSTSGNAKYDVVTAHTGSPNTMVHTQQSVSYAPLAPQWQYGTNPNTPAANGVAMDAAAAMILDWTFSDPDPGDTQGSYALSRQIGAATIAYYRASDSSWVASELQNSSASSQVTLAAATWATGGASAATHTYRVKVWDAAGSGSNYSSTLAIVPSAKANPSFTAPTSGGTITSSKVTVSWAVAEQTAFRLTLATNPGGAVMFDSGWQQSTDTSYTPDMTLASGTGWTIGLTTRNDEGLASTTVTRNFSVSYVIPAAATTAATPMPDRGVIQVAITNPAPAGGQPAFASQELWRRALTTPRLNSNPYFATTAAPWTATGGTFVRSTAQFHEGTASGLLTPDGVTAIPEVRSENCPGFVPGLSYRAAAWLRCAVTRTANINIVWRDGSGNFLSSAGAVSVNLTAGVWAPIELTALAPASTGQAQISVSMGSTPPGSNLLNIDEAEIRLPNDDQGELVVAGLASGATYDDWRAWSGQAFEYRSRVVGANGAFAWGPWTA